MQLTTLTLFLVVFLLFGCAGQEAGPVESEGKLKVVVTTYFLEDFAKAVGGDKVHVESLLPDGANPHTFEPSPKDIARAQSAGVFVYNGLALEPYAEQLAGSLPGSVIIIEASRGISPVESSHHHDHEAEHHHEHGIYDPHVWLDPVLAKQQVDNILKGLENIDPENSNYYRANAEAYEQKLDELDKEIREKTSKFRNKKYIGFHPSFTYFNKRYGLQYAAVIEDFAGDEPSAKEMAHIVDVTRENGITTIFSEPFLDPRAAETIAKEIGGSVVPLDPMATPTQEARAEGKDYLAIMRDNLAKLSEALS